MSDAEERFSTLVGGLDFPMFIVTTASNDSKAGCLVGFTTQMSIDPPRFLVGLSKKNFTYEVAAHATHLAVHFPDRDNEDLAHLFGEETGDEIDKFARCGWSVGPHGVPILEGVAAWFVGLIVDRVDLGDHVGHLLEPVAVETSRTISRVLTYGDLRDFEAGHSA